MAPRFALARMPLAAFILPAASMSIPQQAARLARAPEPLSGALLHKDRDATVRTKQPESGDQPSKAILAAEPVFFFHVPKSGSSFINTLINIPGVCPGLPEGLSVDSSTFGEHFFEGFSRTYDVEAACPGLARQPGFGHTGIGDSYTEHRGHLMTLLRQPEQRVISAFGDMQRALANGESVNQPIWSWAWNADRPPGNLLEFAQGIQGCAVRMLTRAGTPCGGAHPGDLPTPGEVQEARRRLREGFAFVGITDEWPLSMCLFNAMFSLPCRAGQFGNTRPGTLGHDSGKLYDTSELRGFQDPYDGALYNEAREIFAENLQRYNVSTASCGQCLAEAGVA